MSRGNSRGFFGWLLPSEITLYSGSFAERSLIDCALPERRDATRRGRCLARPTTWPTFFLVLRKTRSSIVIADNNTGHKGKRRWNRLRNIGSNFLLSRIFPAVPAIFAAVSASVFACYPSGDGAKWSEQGTKTNSRVTTRSRQSRLEFALSSAKRNPRKLAKAACRSRRSCRGVLDRRQERSLPEPH